MSHLYVSALPGDMGQEADGLRDRRSRLFESGGGPSALERLTSTL